MSKSKSNTEQIGMLLSSILITSCQGDADRPLPHIIQQNIDSFKKHHPDLKHKLFVEEDVIELLQEKFPGTVLDAYSALRPYAYRADLARYCILYEFGGVYADLSYFFANALPIPDERPIVFRDNLVSAPWDTSNGLIFSPPKHKALECAIDMVCANVRRRYYGLNGLCPTGPALFGKALAITCEAEEIITGKAALVLRDELKRFAPNVPLPQGAHVHCQLLNRSLIAVKRKTLESAGLAELGVTTGNVYRDLWNKLEVYS